MTKIPNHLNEDEAMPNMKKNSLHKTHHRTKLNLKYLIVKNNVIKTVKATF
jgi:hypothetical protein